MRTLNASIGFVTVLATLACERDLQPLPDEPSAPLPTAIDVTAAPWATLDDDARARVDDLVTLSATIEVVGHVAPAPLAWTDGNAEAVAVLEVPTLEESGEVTVVLELRGAKQPGQAAVLLARWSDSVSLTLNETTTLTIDDGLVTSAPADADPVLAALFDANDNDASNWDDLFGDDACDPGPPAPLFALSTRDVQFREGDLVEGFSSAVVAVENLTAGDLPGMKLDVIRIDEGLQLKEPLRLVSAQPLAAFAEVLLRVTFAKANDWLGTGAVHFVATDGCGVRQAGTIKLAGNVDGELRPAPDDWQDPSLAAGADLAGLTTSVPAFPADNLWSGEPVRAPSPMTTGAMTLPLSEARVGDFPANAVWLVEVPPQHRLSILLDDVRSDIELRFYELSSPTASRGRRPRASRSSPARARAAACSCSGASTRRTTPTPTRCRSRSPRTCSRDPRSRAHPRPRARRCRAAGRSRSPAVASSRARASSSAAPSVPTRSSPTTVAGSRARSPPACSPRRATRRCSSCRTPTGRRRARSSRSSGSPLRPSSTASSRGGCRRPAAPSCTSAAPASPTWRASRSSPSAAPRPRAWACCRTSRSSRPRRPRPWARSTWSSPTRDDSTIP
jgi:hypothetical protein